jgi:transposase
MIGAMDRHRVQVLRDAGLTQREIAEQTGICERSVRTICSEPRIESLQDAARVDGRGAGRPSLVEPWRARLLAVLEAEPELRTVEVLHRMRQAGYGGGKTALYELARNLRPQRPVAPLVRFEGVPGEFSQHDFGSVDVRYLDGRCERLHFFASRLKYSRWVDVRLVADEKVESLVRSLLLGFEAFGGVPLVAVFDNPKTVVLGRQGGQIQWNETFGHVVLDYRFAPELCTPRRANQKGSVENLVGFVKGSFFKVRRFHDRADLEVQLAAWHLEVNTVRPCRATGVPPAERIAAERERLRALAIAPAEYALRFPVVVGPTGLVTFQGRRYSMPPEAIGIPGVLWLYPERVKIVAGRHQREHTRVPEHGRDSIHPEDRTARLAQVTGKRGRLYLKRQELLDLGPAAEDFLTEIVHRHRFTWQGEVEELHSALLSHGPAAMHRALTAASGRRLYAADHVLRLLAAEAH